MAENGEPKINIASSGDAKAKSLEDAFAELRLSYSSVGDDIGQMYVVHGDSVLLDVLSHPLLDWSRGGQILQFFYQAECTLKKFAHRGRIFKVVFFDSFAGIWTDPAMQFCREMLIEHLKCETKIAVERFASWECDEWNTFLSFTRPSFTVLMNPTSGSLASAKHASISDPSKLLQKMILDLIAKQIIDCVSMSEVSMKSSSMFGFRFVAPREIQNEAAVVTYSADVKESYLGHEGKIDTALVKKISALKIDRDFSSYGVYLYLMICLLRRKNSDIRASLAKNFLLHSFASRCLPLKARAQKLPSAEDMATVSDFTKEIFQLMAEQGLTEFIQAFKWSGLCRCDFLDARLFQKVALLTSKSYFKKVKELGLPPKMESAIENLWRFVATEAKLRKDNVSFMPVWKKGCFGKLKEFTDKESEQVQNLIRESDSITVTALKIQKDTPLKEASNEKDADTKDQKEIVEAPEEDWDAEEVEEWDAEDDAGDDNWEAEADGNQGAKENTDAPDLSERSTDNKASITKGVSLDRKVDINLNRKAVSGVRVAKLADSKMLPIFVGDIESTLEQRKVLSTELAAAKFVRDGSWLLDKEIDDGTNPPPDPEPQTKYERKKMIRAKGKYIAYLDKYAKSLKGGGIIYRDVVVSQKSEVKSKDQNKGKHVGGKGKGKGKAKKSGGSKKLSMREKIRMDVEKKQREKALENVKVFIKHASSMKTLEKRIETLDNSLVSLSEPYAVVPGLMQLLDWCVEYWKVEKAKGSMTAAVRLFQMVMDIFRRFKNDISVDQLKELQSVLLRLGFQEAASLLVDQFIKARPERLSRKDLLVAMPKTKELSVGIPSYRFQLMYAGHLMVRNVDSAPDDRVSGFYPDKWQRNLLDVVDRKESALVVAPTSSGKTFVSYYAMKQALFDNKTIKRSTDRSIIVYVAPTKALVNQVSADVYARYGMVFGVMTLDYSVRLKECEVLITIPECLETLLLSPESEVWTRCIKYVVFDEVHCLGSTENGAVWERLLKMVRCPFIALSATLGNPDDFSEWMGRIQQTHNRKINLIIHRTRWSDLIKYMYLPSELPQLTALQGQTHVLPSFEYVHPCSALGTELAKTGFPPDLNFSPKDCMLLYDAMLTCKVPQDVQKRLSDLHPLKFFKDLLYIKKYDAQKFEAALKDELYRWSANGMKNEILELVGLLTKNLDKGITNLETYTERKCYGVEYLKENFMPLMVDLLNADYLPAVVFNLDREICEDLVASMLFKLESMEAQTLEAEGNNIKKKTKDYAKQQKQAKRERDKDKKRNKDEDADPGDEEGTGPVEEDPIYFVDPRFSFIGSGQSMESGEMEWWLDRLLRKTKWPRTHLLIRALQRGIGVHHDELERSYKDLVETLFRTKHLKVVVATSTLALGVNMPARTTVFCGDSPNLNPLRYRQMAGRAGRRGYDNIGNVVFVGIPPKKVYRLMTSSLVSLHGHFPMTPTVALRMVNHYGKVAAKANSQMTLANILKEPFFKNREEISTQAKFHFRFSLQYLLEQDLIKYTPEKDLQVHGSGALAVHLRFAQPGNILFVRLWDEGLFDEICKKFQGRTGQQEILRKLMLVMSHIFFRQPLPVGTTKESLVKADLDPTESKSYGILPKLSKKIQKIMDDQRSSALRLYSSYIKHSCLPKQEAQEQDETESLPISSLKLNNIEAVPTTFLGRLAAARIPAIARSEYYRMSGHSDDFASFSEMCDTVKPNLNMDLDAMPACEMKDHQLRDMPLNAYASDFFRHGSLTRLIKENGLTSAKAWYLLKQWSYLLKDIAKGVKELRKPTDKEVEYEHYYGEAAPDNMEKNETVKAFVQLNSQFQELFRNWNRTQTNERKKMEEIKKQEIQKFEED